MASQPKSPSSRAELIDRLLKSKGISAPRPQGIARRAADEPTPLSFAQQRLWFLDQLDPGSAAYNLAGAVRLTGVLDVDALARSLGEIVRRHEVLRTTFSSEGGSERQVIHAPAAITLPVLDLSAEPAETREQALQRAIAAEAERPFDLMEGPLVRLLLVRLSPLASEGAPSEHVLVHTMHHIISDAWSMGVLVRELGAHYASFSSGQAPSLPELPIQYGDYAVWQRAQVQGDVLDKQTEYFRDALSGAPHSLDLPTDRPRPPHQTFAGDLVKLELSPALSRDLKSLCRSEGATLYAGLLAAFSALLSRITGQDDIVVGTPNAGRVRTETESLIGFFVNTMVLRTDVSGDPTFRELVARAKETARGAFANADVPFERLVEALRPERDPRRPPLFQVALSLENLNAPELRLPGLVLSPIAASSRTSKFDLMMTLVEGPERLSAEIEYNVDLFDRSRIERLAQHFQNLLTGAVAHPDARVRALPLLTDAERLQIVVEWNDTARDFPQDVRLHQLFEAQVDKTPDATAVVFEGDRVSYRELDERANRLAHRLRGLGVGRDVLVCLLLERSVEMVVSLLGVLKAGAAYVPLDPEYPSDRLAFMLDDAGSPVVITQPHLLSKLPETSAVIVRLGDGEDDTRQEPNARPAVEILPTDLAYAIYTSGSTGKPKGVLNAHEGIVNRILWTQSAYSLTQDDRVVQKTPYGFDVSVWEFFWPLAVGARLIVARPEGHKDPDYIAELIQSEGVTTLHFVPSMLQAFLEHPGLEALTSVRHVLCSGEALPPSLRDRFFQRFATANLHNLYGPTEAAIDVTHFTCERGVTSPIVPIGKPVANTQMYVLDPDLQPVPVGTPGELHIGGVQVARGYLKRPELTAERFVRDPFRGAEGARLYKTGDLARFLPGGTIEYLGRIDHQVKLRGFRIELGEIEAAIAAQPGVRDAVVLLREDAPGDKRLVAYVVAQSGESLDVTLLSAPLKRALPDYMVPSAFVAMEALPLISSGKVDRKALPVPDLPAAVTGEIVAPRNPIEQVLAGIFADVCKVERVSVEASFFDLGGQSLLATQVVARASEALGVKVPLRALFDAPTVAELALVVEAKRREGGEAPVPALAVVPRDASLPLSFGQERLWFLFQLEPESAFYNIPLGLRMKGSLDEGALRRALEELVVRHEVLRTTYKASAGRPTAVVHAAMPLPLALLDLSDLPEEAREPRARAEAQADLDRPFDLFTGPVLRTTLVRLASDDHVLLMTAHHMVIDIWTTGILFSDVAALYQAYCSGEPSPLAPLPVQYADYAAWQRAYLSGETLDAELAYWAEALGGAPTALDLPTDRPRPPVQTFRGSHASIRFSPELSASLRALCRREGVTPYMTALAVFNVLLFRYTGQEDILVGTSRADRRHRETEGLVGYFLNQLVLRTKLDQDPSFRELLGRVRETTLSAYAHQDMPFERIVELLRPERDLSRSPVFQVMVDNMRLPAFAELPGLTLSGWKADIETSRFDLTLALAESDDGFFASLEYNADLFDHTTALRMLAHFQSLLESGAEEPARKLSELTLLTAAERQRIVVDWNDTARDYATDTCIHRLIEAQVAKTPDAIAVRCAGETLTYRELDARSNKVARYLQSLGAGPDVKVAVCVERSLAMVVGVLGVLKSGAAYVPFDPAWPAERLGFLLEDTGAPILLTQEKVVDELPAFYIQITCLDSDWAMIDAQSDAPVTSEATGESLAYVIYTSGSTGKPKGVLVAHENLVHSTLARLAYYEEPVTSFLLLSSFAFDSSMAGIYWTLLQGGTITLPHEGLVEDPAGLAALIAETRLSHLLCVPSLYTFLLAVAKDEQLASLRAVIVAGESAPLDTVKQHHARFPETRLFNEYGPTEATVWCSVYETGKDEPGPRVSIGKPIANTQIYLLDPSLRPVPVGVPGELYVGGKGITRGYLNRSELSAEKFVASPFAEGETLYRTGDLARFRDDGNIDFLGRIDHQVKIRGYRIELEEIESVLAQSRSVLESVVIVREDAPGDLRLVAYVVASGATPPSASELRSLLGEQLPEYMVPSAFVVLEAMPLLPNGKIDRKKLPAPETRAGIDSALVAPRSPVEDVIAGIWGDVLGGGKVGIHDNFFELGGHSLLATQVVAKIVETFKVDVALHSLFDSPTVAGLAAAVDEAVREGHGLTVTPIEQASRDKPLPLSFGQERLWVLDQIEPNSSFYNLPGAVRLEGELDADVLSRSIALVVARHEVLRTTFGAEAGRPALVIHETMDLSPTLVDLSDLPEEERDLAAQREAEQDAARPFDLAAGPLARTRLLKLSEGVHVLVFTMHHIVADGWSMGVLVRELGIAYAALQNDETPNLGELPIQYADYASWQRQWMRGDVLEKELAYWREALRGAPTALDLPTDRPRPPVQTYRGARVNFAYSPELSKAALELCRKESVTLYMLALAAFNTLLFRWSGQEDILVGTSVADRRRSETEGLIGYFLNQLVFRTKMDGEPTFRELLARVREASLGAYAHQDLSFERLVEEMRLSPDMSRTPLFQVMVDVPNAPARALTLPGLTLRGALPEMKTARFDLTLSLSEQKDGLFGSLEYATDLFDATTIARMLSHLETLLTDAVESPDKRLWELSMLGEEERRLLVTEWNDTARDYPRGSCVHPLFEAQVDETPDAIAVVSGDETVTYRELDLRANRLAHHLAGLGVGPDVLVGLCLPRTVDLVVAILGVLKAGGAYVPLDPTYPVERIFWMLEDSMVPVVVTNEELEGTLPAQSAMLVRLDGDEGEIAAQPSERPDAGALPENLAYMIYTSGSTGKPKGAMIEHRGVVNYLTWAHDAYDVDKGDGAPVHSSVSFDLTVTGLYAPLLAGKTVFLVPEGDEVVALGDALRTHQGYSLVKLTPAHLEVLAQSLSPSEIAGATGAFVIGGEALSWGTLAFFRENAKGTKLINEYGPTETVVGCCVYDGAEGEPGRGAVPIGKPIANTQLYVLDKHFGPTPIGAPGELYIGGDGVGRGYWNLPELTEERFVKDPFREGGRLYKTGDLARWLPSGQLEFLGRLDHQVKVRGYRIELGEIEAALRSHGALGEVLVIAREDAPGDKRLVAYVIPTDGEEAPDAPTLKAHLAASLPDYMIPSAFVVLDALPLTENGKVDRKALPAPEARGGVRETHVAPRNAVEQTLAGIWTDVLGAADLGVNDDFFELGGHSLIATQVLARVRSALHVDLPFRTIFEAPTIAALAERVAEKMGPEAPAASETIPRVARDAELPLSFAQERLWFLDQLEPMSTAFVVPEALRLTGQLDVEALRRALRAFIARHEVLRTTFPTKNGEACVVIHDDFRFEVPLTSLLGLPTAAREQSVRAEVSRDGTTPFDLAKGPLVRAKLLCTGETEHVLLFTTHHIVSDAWSVGVLLREVTALYVEALGGEKADLPPLPIQYVDFSAWQRKRLSAEVQSADLAYWSETLAGVAALDLPIDRPRPAEQTFAGAKVTFRLPKRVSKAIDTLCREESATPFMLLGAAFALLLGRYANQEDVALGTPVANRSREETEGLFGLFLNTLVLRADLSGDPSFRALLRRMREAALGAQAHQELPFERVVDALAPVRDMGRTPLFQALFVLQNAPEPARAMGGLSLERVQSDEVTAKLEIALALAESEDGLVGAFEYNTDLFDKATIERMSASFQRLLSAALERPDDAAHALPILSDTDRETLLVGWNATEEVFPGDLSVTDLIAARAARSPSAPAVVFEGETLSYSELEKRSNQLARHLQSLGVTRDVLVGLCVERSAAMVVAMLGILKAGGAYVPLDPEYPKARLELILEDASAPVLVTETSLAGLLPGHRGAVVHLDVWDAVASLSDAPLPRAMTPESAAYAIYTSGSTGKPKGVVIPHRALTNFVETMRKTPGIAESDRLLAVTSLSFDIAGLEIYVPLAAGGCVDVASRALSGDGIALAERLRETGATVMQATPATWRILLDSGWQGQEKLTMLCGGEALPRSLADALLPKGAALWNMFGPTETTIWSSIHRVARGSGFVPIGRPIANTQLYVLDARMSPVPIGAAGELYIGGEGLARGYLNRPELSAERFVASPFAQGGRLYRTGDLARWLPTGEVEFLGRLDHQVKLHGFRIELGEIEAALAKHPAVKEAVVLAREDAPLPKRLVAYVVTDGQDLSRGDARAFLMGTLPDYMLPSVVVRLDRLPLTPNGKVDRRALPAPSVTREEGHEAVAPQGAVEEALAAAFASVLGVATVGVHDNFFEMGGDSISSILVVSRARQAGVRVTPRQVFQHQTVAELARVADAAPVVVAEQGPVTGAVPLTPIVRAWLERAFENRDHFTQAVLLEAVGALDAGAMERAVALVLSHHDALRLRLAKGQEGDVQTIGAPGGPSPFSSIDLSNVADPDLDAAIERVATEAQTTLDLAEGRIVRVVLFDLGTQRPARLLWVVHHVAIDGVSWRILLEDLWTAYEAEKAGRPGALLAKTTSWKQWAERLTAYAGSEQIQGEIEHWRAAGRASKTLLPSAPGGDLSEAGATRVVVTLDEATTESLLKKAMDAYKTEAQDLLLTALAKALSGLSGSRATSVALEGHGREDLFDDVDVTRTVGWFTTQYPVLLDLAGADGPGGEIKAVKEQLRAVPSGGVGFGLLRYVAGGETAKALAAAGEPEVSFNYLGQLDQAAGEGSPLRPVRGSLGPTVSPKAKRAHLLEVGASVQEGALRATFTFSEGVHTQEAIEGVAGAFIEALRGLVEHCLSPEAGGYTPSDFEHANVSQETLDMLLAMDDDDEDDEDA